MNYFIAVSLTLLFFVQIVYYTSRYKLRDRYAFLWIVIALGGVFTSLCTPSLDRLAHRMGVSYMPSVVFLSVIIVMLSILVHLTIALSKHQEMIKVLAQEYAFLEKEMKEMSKQAGGE